jgi:outer membrane protein
MIFIFALALFQAFGAFAQTQSDTNAPVTAAATDTNAVVNGSQSDTNAPVAPVPSDTNAVVMPPASSNANTAAALVAVDTNQPPRKERILSLQDCIQLALQHNLDIQIQRYNPSISQYTLDVSYDAYEPVLTVSASHDYNASAGFLQTTTNGTQVPSPGFQSEENNYTPEIKGSLPTGLTYNMSGTWSRTSTWSVPNGTPGGYWLSPAWSSGPGITLDQPLLRNFWIDQTRLTIQLNKVALQTSEQAVRLQIMQSITAVKNAYYNLLFSRGNIDANTTAFQLAEQLAANNKKQVEIGTLAPLDEKQAESQAAASLAALQAARQALVVQENTLKNLLTDNYMAWVDVSPKPSDELAAVPQLLDRQTSWRRALVERPELVQAQLNAKKQGIQVKYDLNQIFPQVDLTGSYGRNAFSTNVGDNFRDLDHGDTPFYSYGLIFSIPLGGSLGARNTYHGAKESLRQVQLQLKQEEQTILVAVDNDVGQVESTLEQVNSTHAARLYAEDALKAEQTKLENGKSTSFNVLQLISNLTTARVNEIQALANYNIAITQLSLDRGSTIEDNHIDLKVK